MKSNALFSRWLVLAVALGLVFGLASWSPSSSHDDLTVIVVPDVENTFSFIDVNGDGIFSTGDPFVIQGALLKEDMTATIGRYLCRGWFIADPSTNMPPFFAGVGEFTFVHQSFEIFGRGTIHVEGNESSDSIVRAIVGTNGDFKFKGKGTLLAEPMGDVGLFVVKATFRFKR